jgi:hypothetical protein
MADRWCLHCNVYQSTPRCAKCGKSTARADVLLLGQVVKEKPKIKCACGAPFGGLRFVDLTGYGLKMHYEASLPHDGGKGELSVRLRVEVPGVVALHRPTSAPTWHEPTCPNCQAPLVRASMTHETTLPLRAKFEIGRRQDQALMLVCRVHLEAG